jgi:hypothetical protein
MSVDASGTDEVVEPPAGTEGSPNPEGEGAGESGENKEPMSPEAYEKALERMRAADRAKSAAEQREAELAKRLREFEDKDKSELEKAQRNAEEAIKERDEAHAALQRERINNAFLTSNTYAWHNSERALSLLDLSEVTIKDDGKVEGLDKAIASLAKSDPYLIKTSDETKGSDLPPSGSPAGSGAKNGKATTDRDKLMDKYPALRR